MFKACIRKDSQLPVDVRTSTFHISHKGPGPALGPIIAVLFAIGATVRAAGAAVVMHAAQCVPTPTAPPMLPVSASHDCREHSARDIQRSPALVDWGPGVLAIVKRAAGRFRRRRQELSTTLAEAGSGRVPRGIE